MMKLRKILSALLAAVMCTAFSAVTVFAENTDKVADYADVLTDNEEQKLEAAIMNVIEKYDYSCDIAVVTVNSTDGKSMQAYADDYFDYNGYGYDSKKSGVLLLNNVSDRKWHISTRGKGIDVFTDNKIDRIGNEITDELKDGGYFDAYDEFAELADEYIGKYEKTGGKNYLKIFVISALIGLIAALIVCLGLKSQLKTAVRQVNARQYVKSGSRDVTYARDIFLYRKVSKTKIESNNGSSTHRSSSGAAHGGRGGSY